MQSTACSQLDLLQHKPQINPLFWWQFGWIYNSTLLIWLIGSSPNQAENGQFWYTWYIVNERTIVVPQNDWICVIQKVGVLCFLQLVPISSFIMQLTHHDVPMTHYWDVPVDDELEEEQWPSASQFCNPAIISAVLILSRLGRKYQCIGCRMQPRN